VRRQAAVIATAAFSAFLPLALVALVATSAWTGWVNVMAMHTYLDHPGALPGAMWAVPIAVQTFIFAGEATMVLNSVLRRRWILISGAGAVAAGYGTELAAHVRYGETADVIATMLVAAVASGGGWALVAALLDRGVRIADEAGAAARPREDRLSAADGNEEGGARNTRRGRRTREQLLDAVRSLEPERPTLSPNFVATRVGISWGSARALLQEAGRLARPGDEPAPGPQSRTAE
jgi:hypothetical protein